MKHLVLASVLVLALVAIACADEDLDGAESLRGTVTSSPSAEATSSPTSTPAPVRTASPADLLGTVIEIWVYRDHADVTGACIDVLAALVPVGLLDVADAVVGRCLYDGRTFTRVFFAPSEADGVFALQSIELLMLVRGPDPADPCGGRLQPVPADEDPAGANCLTVRRVVPHLPGEEPPTSRPIWMALPETARGVEVPPDAHCWELVRYFEGLEGASPIRARCLLD
ncbi:MAG: hypothetical protein R3C39_09375 [Dehalococcoidia bacterium]